jgi:hypothetical protein
MNQCALCKGHKLLCGRSFCPILRKVSVLKSVYKLVDRRELFGSSPPSVFVGEYGYPVVRVAPLLPPIEGDTSYLDNPLKWKDISLEDVIRYRSMLVMGERRVNVKAKLEDLQELALSVKPVDAEMVLKRKPVLRVIPSDFSPILSPRAEVEKFKVVENPKVPSFVERLVDDELKARDAVISLYEKGFDEYYVIRLFSAGLLGIDKRITPTRWSITAVEDILGNYLKREIVNFKPINSYEVYHGEFLGNRYTVLLMPKSYAFELLEVWLKGSLFGCDTPQVLRDYEFFEKKGYAEETSGAYYSARLSVLEYLRKRKRQARAVVFREITPDYYIPVGAWQIRLGVEKALENRIGVFDDLKSALNAVRNLLIFPLDRYLERSVILRTKTLSEFVK